VFEAIVVLTFPDAPAPKLLGSLLAYRAIYYLVPLVVAAVLFLVNEILARGNLLVRAHRLTSAFIAPVVPTGRRDADLRRRYRPSLLRRDTAVHGRLAVIERVLPLPVLEISHLAGSVIGLALLVLARALLRRVNAAYHIAYWLLVAASRPRSPRDSTSRKRSCSRSCSACSSSAATRSTDRRRSSQNDSRRSGS
jgi:phosphatidylglycerol lysyltransferase